MMNRRVMALLAVLICSLTSAQDAPVYTISYDGIAFAFSGAVASGVQVSEAESGVNVSPFAMFPAESPRHTLFTFLDYIPADSEDINREKFHAPEIRVYRVADLAGYALDGVSYADEAAALTALLAAHPDDLAAEDHLPFLPLIPGVQTLHAREHYLENDSVTGIAYLTHRADRAGIILEGRVLYTFQGISKDGCCYIAAWLSVDSGVLPVVFDYKSDVDAIMQNYDLYRSARIVALEGQAAEAYYPPLGALDALFGSMTIQAGTAAD